MTVPTPAPGPRPAPGSTNTTALLSAVTVLAGCGSLYLSLMFALAGDSSSYQARGGDAVLLLAYVVTWAGAATAMWLTFRGITKASRRRQPTWPWPVAGLALIGATFVAGLLIANSLFTPH